ncbi:hypothetical protein NN561_018483 [Cricetulus griseus]
MDQEQGLAMGMESELGPSQELEPTQVRAPGPNWVSIDEGFGNGKSLGAQQSYQPSNGYGAEAELEEPEVKAVDVKSQLANGSRAPPPPSALALAELPPLPALPLRPELLAPWGPGVHLALPELPPEVCAPAPPAAALALQDLPRLPAPAPPPAHLPLPPLPEAAVAAIPGPVGARGRPPLLAEPPPQPLPPLPARPSPFTLLAPPLPREPWPLPVFPPPLPPPPPPPYFFLSPPC